MLKLNLPEYNFRIIKQNGRLKIFDTVRKAFVNLTPEEWVRQNFIRFLTEEKNVPPSHIAIEKELSLNGTLKRTDAIVYDMLMQPAVLIEFKAPDILPDTKVFEQINRYNSALCIKFIVVSNGIRHYFAQWNTSQNAYEFINDLPLYSQL